MHNDPHAIARGMGTEVKHGRLGSVKTLGCPVKFSETPSGTIDGAPIYGQHTRAVLAEFGYADEEIKDLISDGAVVAAEG